MKKITLLLLFSFSIFFAQTKLSKDYKYTISSPYKVFEFKDKAYFTKNNHSVSIKINGNKVLIQKYSNDKPGLLKQKLYEKYFPKNYYLESIIEFSGRFFVFYSSWNGKEDKEQLFYVEVDSENCEFKGEPKLLVQVNGKIEADFAGFRGFSFVSEGKFDVFVSHDKSNLLVKYKKKAEKSNDKKNYDVIGLFSFDNNLNKSSEREIKMPYTERRMDNLDYQLDNHGNLYMLEKIFHDDSNEEKKKKNDKIANYHIELLTLREGSNQFEITKFENNEKFINKLWMFDTSNNYLVCGGFYSDGKGDYDDCNGILTFKVDLSGKIYDQTYHEISADIINQFESLKTIKNNEKRESNGEKAKLTDFELSDLIIQNDGSIILIGEQQFVRTYYHNSIGGGYYTTHSYHYNDIIITKINPNGELNWINKIPKTQAGTKGKGGMSYKYLYANNNHYLIFLDNIKNIDLPKDKTPAVHTDRAGGYLTAVKIKDIDGTLNKDSILNGRDIQDFQMYKFAVSSVIKTSDNSFMFEVYKDEKEDILIKIDMN